jgi:alpha-glucosidase
MASYLDFTNPGAYAFWKYCVRSQLVEKGYRNIWNDNNEYDVLDKDVLACGFGQQLPARRIRPLFSYLMARASREACAEARGEGFLPFNISRCGIAGTQRVATTWTGDNLTDFRDLRYNHYQAMTMALTGISFFGPDIGGFAGPKPDAELFLRWLQYGVFLPRFVLHSWKPGEPATMPWLYPEHMDAVKRIFALREKLVPYLREEMERSVRTHDPLIYPVFLAQPGYDPESDCFFCGDKILACPVFDSGAESVSVLLPEAERGWQLRGAGESIPGGSRVCVPCMAEDEPVWFIRAGDSLS